MQLCTLTCMIWKVFPQILLRNAPTYGNTTYRLRIISFYTARPLMVLIFYMYRLAHMFQLQTELTFSVSVLSYIGLPWLPWQSWICWVENAAKRILHQLFEQGYLDWEEYWSWSSLGKCMHIPIFFFLHYSIEFPLANSAKNFTVCPPPPNPCCLFRKDARVVWNS